MKALFNVLGIALVTWIAALVIVVQPASASAYQPIRAAPSRPIGSATFVTYFNQDELSKRFYIGYTEADFSADEAARRSEELAARFEGTVELTLTAGGAMSAYDLDTGSALTGCSIYRMDRVHLFVGDGYQDSGGVYRWSLLSDVLNLDVVSDPDPARIVVLTLHPWVRVI